MVIRKVPEFNIKCFHVNLTLRTDRHFVKQMNEKHYWLLFTFFSGTIPVGECDLELDEPSENKLMVKKAKWILTIIVD